MKRSQFLPAVALLCVFVAVCLGQDGNLPSNLNLPQNALASETIPVLSSVKDETPSDGDGTANDDDDAENDDDDADDDDDDDDDDDENDDTAADADADAAARTMDITVSSGSNDHQRFVEKLEQVFGEKTRRDPENTIAELESLIKMVQGADFVSLRRNFENLRGEKKAAKVLRLIAGIVKLNGAQNEMLDVDIKSERARLSGLVAKRVAVSGRDVVAAFRLHDRATQQGSAIRAILALICDAFRSQRRGKKKLTIKKTNERLQKAGLGGSCEAQIRGWSLYGAYLNAASRAVKDAALAGKLSITMTVLRDCGSAEAFQLALPIINEMFRLNMTYFKN